jgi:hypothetical protein
MIGLNHAGTGIVIALTVRRPEIALPLAFVSHFILDIIPHSLVAHKRQYMIPYLIAEALGAVILTLTCMVLFPELWLLIGACAVLAYLPDFLWPLYYKTRLGSTVGFREFFAFHKKIQWSESYRGWLVDALYFSVIVIFLATYRY